MCVREKKKEAQGYYLENMSALIFRRRGAKSVIPMRQVIHLIYAALLVTLPWRPKHIIFAKRVAAH